MNNNLILVGSAILGGFLAAVIAAGYNSYANDKIPDKTILFRWFIGGLLFIGISVYVWLFGVGADFKNIVENANSVDLIAGISAMAATATTKPIVEESSEPELIVGMPNF